MNGDPGLTLTYFTTKSNLVACAFEWENCYEVLKLDKLAADDQINRILHFFKKKNDPGGCLPLPRCYLHVYEHFSNILSLKALRQSKPNFM